MPNRKKCEKVLEKIIALLAGQVREKMSAGESVGRALYTFEVYGTENRGRMELKGSPLPGGRGVVSLGVHRRDSDRLHSYFLFSGEPWQLLEKLQDPATAAEWLRDLESLSHREDEDD